LALTDFSTFFHEISYSKPYDKTIEMNTKTGNDHTCVLNLMERIETLKPKRRALEWEADGRRRNGKSNEDGWRKLENE